MKSITNYTTKSEEFEGIFCTLFSNSCDTSVLVSCISSTESETPARISGSVSQSSSNSADNSTYRRRKTFIEMTPKNYVLFLTL